MIYAGHKHFFWLFKSTSVNYIEILLLTLRAGVVSTSSGISLKLVRVVATQNTKMKRTRVKTTLTWPPSSTPGRVQMSTSSSLTYRVSLKRRPIAKIIKVVISHYFTVLIITEYKIRNIFFYFGKSASFLRNSLF